LLVEDEPEMVAVLRQGFAQDRYVVKVAVDGRLAVQAALEQRFDAIVLDVMLPGLDGYGVATELRGAGNRTPILMLTARDSVTDIVRGLDCGVEDYLTKPFSFLELSARVRALIRRNQAVPARLCIGDLTLDAASHVVMRGDNHLRLTKTEFRVLERLMRNAGHVVRRSELMGAGWGESMTTDDNNLDVTMSSLRSKVDKGRKPVIHTIRGFGYKMEAR
jgi:DNA-binding response OmpR family regulator